MSAWGQKRPWGHVGGNVRLPEAGMAERFMSTGPAVSGRAERPLLLLRQSAAAVATSREGHRPQDQSGQPSAGRWGDVQCARGCLPTALVQKQKLRVVNR